MPPKEACPHCHEMIQDWHLEWYKSEGPALFKGTAAMDCPRCGNPVGFARGKIGLAASGITMVRRNVDKAARWAAAQALSSGGTLRGYLSANEAGSQYLGYWTTNEVDAADASERARSEGF